MSQTQDPRRLHTLPDLNALDLEALFTLLNSAADLRSLFDRVRREDLGAVGDVTTDATIDPRAVGRAVVSAREAGVIAGLRAIPDLLVAYSAELTWRPFVEDGQFVNSGVKVGELRGRLADLLAVERPLLNLLTRLSGIASLTARYVELIHGSRSAIYDTRKTTPGLRGLEKYAVRCGGGRCHRLGLHDAVLIKDNHLAAMDARERGNAAGPVGQRPLHEMLTHALQAVRARQPLRFVEIEVDTLEQFDEMLKCPPGTLDIVLLDNMTTSMMCEAVARRDRVVAGWPAGMRLELEASGGVSLEVVAEIAHTGVERISIGALTHSAIGLDLGLDME